MIFKKHPEASKKELPISLIDFSYQFRSKGDILTKLPPLAKFNQAYQRAKYWDTSKLVEKINNTKISPARVGFLRELRDRNRLKEYPAFEKEYEREFKKFSKLILAYEKADPLTKAISPLLVGTAAGIGAMILAKPSITGTTVEKTEEFLASAAKRKGISNLRIRVDPEYGSILSTVFGGQPGPHFKTEIESLKKIKFPKTLKPKDLLKAFKEYKKIPKIPVVATSPNIGIAAHEMGHAISYKDFLKKIPKLKKLYELGYRTLPKIGPLYGLPILAVPAVALAFHTAKIQARGGDVKVVPEFIEKQPEILAAPAALPMLTEEAQATGRGLGEVIKYFKPQGTGKVIREVGKMLTTTTPAFGSYVAGAAVPLIGLKAYKDYAKKKHEYRKEFDPKYKYFKKESEFVLEKLGFKLKVKYLGKETKGKKPFNLYNIIAPKDHPKYKSTITADTLKKLLKK